MSGVLKGVKKVFKTVGKVVKKVLPYALPIAAAVFTIGGFLGIPAMAGGWGGAVSGLFGNSMLGSVLGGAVTQAGYGGLAGMAIGGITGGKKGMLKGSLIGQAAGAVTGGITGAVGYAGNAPARAAQAGPGAQAPGGAGVQQGLGRSTDVMRGYGADLPGQVAGSTGMGGRAMVPASAGLAQTQAAQGVTRAAQQLPSAGMVPGMAAPAAGQAAAAGGGWWANEDPFVKAAMITTGGVAIPKMAEVAFAGDDDDNPQLAVENARREAIAKNYAGFSASPPSPASLTLANRPTLRYTYDQTQHRIVPTYG